MELQLVLCQTDSMGNMRVLLSGLSMRRILQSMRILSTKIRLNVAEEFSFLVTKLSLYDDR